MNTEVGMFACIGYKFTSKDNSGEVVGRARLYILDNDLHERPFGLLEDVFVEEASRGQGLANLLVKQIFYYANKAGCYKLIATSRDDGTREEVHAWYLRLGFVDYGTEFRLNL